MTEEKLLELLQDMSLKEKIGQMMQLDVSCFKNEGPVTGSAVEQGIAEEDLTLAGSILGAVEAEEIERLQKKCMERQPHHIDPFCMETSRYCPCQRLNQPPLRQSQAYWKMFRFDFCFSFSPPKYYCVFSYYSTILIC